jgi:hypothetical protein
MGENTYGVLADGRCIRRKWVHRKGFVVKPTDYPDLRILKQKPDTVEQEDDDDDDE